MPAGRPSTFTQEIADRICERMGLGESLRSICKDDDMPASITVRMWRRKRPEFAAQYAQACEDRAEECFDRMFENAEECDGTPESVAKARLCNDTIKWGISKMMPKVYGAKPGDEGESGDITIKVVQFGQGDNAST